MSLWTDKPLIIKWILETCQSNGVPELFPKIKWEFNSRFISKLGDASYKNLRLRFSAVLWARATIEQKEQVVKHETCHLVAFSKFGPAIKAHGLEWASTMRLAGQVPERTHKVQTAKKTIEVKCTNCTKVHLMGLIRARKMKAGISSYLCRDCNGQLVFV